MKKLAILLAVALVPSGAIAAQGASAPLPSAASPMALTSDLLADKLVDEGGVEKHVLSEPKVIVPGDHLVFRTQYRNTGAAPVANFVVTNPVHPAVLLADDAAAALTLSVDGGKNWGHLATLTVSDGKGGTRPAAAADVTHVRWVLPLVKPGEAGTLSYNAIVR